MQIGSDATALQIRGLDRPLQEELPLPLGRAHLSRETQRQRDLHDRESHERDGEDR